jgi:signal recognition particle receptor subunit beta
VRALSEIPPLLTQETMTVASVGVDDVAAVPGKSTTTVAMDFGRRIDESFPAVDYCENRQLPFVVAINGFPGTEGFGRDAVRDALALAPDVPVLRMDARSADSCLATLIALVEHALERTRVAR